MKNLPRKRACLATVLFCCFPLLSFAQLIAVKSVPVAAAEQFLLVPSQNLGMGGVAIALEDASHDPFVNPAKGARIQGAYVFSAPVFSSIFENNGSARTLPFGTLLGLNTWFGGMNVAAQQFSKEESAIISAARTLDNATLTSALVSEQNPKNLYAAGLIGKKFPGTGLALAASASWAELEALQGVDFLYANSSRINQYGHIADYRVGLLYEESQRPSFELLLLHHRVNMTHEVYYDWWFWEGDVIWPGNRMVQNLDQTNTWGLHAGTTIPLGSESSRAGLIFTANKKSHPKIPNYELMNIPRDPGDTWAFNFGAGIAHVNEDEIFGMDLIYEPIWSHTWADAAEPVRTARDEIIPAGGMTVENYFRFNNLLVRLGLRAQERVAGFQLGLQARFIAYELKQEDFVAGTRRTQKEFWGEWTPTLGLNLNFSSFQIRYTGALTAGTGQPGVAFGRSIFAEAEGQSYIIAPSGRLTLQEAVVLTHQIAVAVALPLATR